MSLDVSSSYPAISTSTNVCTDSLLRLPEYTVPGFGVQKSERCNTPSFVDYCPDCKHTEVHSYHCNRWDCPVCYPYTAAKAARQVANRVWGVNGAWCSHGSDIGHINHIVISVPPSEYEGFDEKASKKLMVKHAKRIGLSGGAVVFHPYRLPDDVEYFVSDVMKERGLKGGNWKGVHDNVLRFGYVNGRFIDSWLDYVEFSPHWHIIGYFKLKERSDSFFESTGWTYKNVSMEKYGVPLDRAGIKGTVRYLCTHHRIEKGRQSVTYFGIASPNKVKREVIVKIEVAKCPECYQAHKVVDLEGNVNQIVSRGDMYRIPVRSSTDAEKLLDNIRCRKFKFNPKDYSKSLLHCVYYFYSVRTEFAKSVKKVKEKPLLNVTCHELFDIEASQASMKRYLARFPPLDENKQEKHRVG
jgi:hypothetical protein